MSRNRLISQGKIEDEENHVGSQQPRKIAASDVEVGGDKSIKWLEILLPMTIPISIIGGCITFTVIVSQIADPATLNDSSNGGPPLPFFHRETVRLFLAMGWLCFMTALGSACTVTAFMIYFRNRKVWAALISGFLECMILLATFFLSLAVSAYVKPVGLIAVTFTGIFTVAVAAFWIAVHTIPS